MTCGGPGVPAPAGKRFSTLQQYIRNIDTAICHLYLGLCDTSIINLNNADQAIAAAGLSVGAVALQVPDLLIQTHVVCLLACQLPLTLLHLPSARGDFFLQL